MAFLHCYWVSRPSHIVGTTPCREDHRPAAFARRHRRNGPPAEPPALPWLYRTAADARGKTMRPIASLLLLTLLCATLLNGCSRATLVYRNLDLVVPWTPNAYLDLAHRQKDELPDSPRHTLAWPYN